MDLFEYSVFFDVPNATEVVGTPAQSLSSDGSNGNYLSATNPASLKFTETDTVLFGCWVNLAAVVNSGFLGMLDSEQTNAFYLGTDGDGKADFVYFTGSVSEVVSASALSTNTKYFVLAWIDPATETINLKVNMGNTASTDYSGTAAPFTFATGDFFLANDGDDNIKLNGRLDEVFICKNPANLTTAITTIESEIYNSGTGRRYGALSSGTKTTIGLQNWWGLDETSSTREDLHASLDLTPAGTVAAGTALVS